VAVVEHSDAQRLGQADGQPRPRRVVAQDPLRVHQPGDRQPVLGLRIVNAVTAGHRRACSNPDVEPAAQNLRQELHRQDVAGPADEVDRHHRPTTHRVDIRERIGRSDPAPVIGVVDDGSEEVSSTDHRQPVLDPKHGSIVAVLDPHQKVRRRHHREPREHLLELPRRDLAGAAAAMGKLRQAVCLGVGVTHSSPTDVTEFDTLISRILGACGLPCPQSHRGGV
jgi:hypothetical protein